MASERIRQLHTIVCVLSCWFAYCTFVVPPSANASYRGDVLDLVPVKIQGVQQQQLFSVNSNTQVTGISLVPVLLFGSSPATIGGFIIPVWINSIEGMTLTGLQSHIAEKIFKAISPAITDGDSSSSIVMEVVIFGIKASAFHLMPRAVFCGSMHSMLSGVFACLPTFTHPTSLTSYTHSGLSPTQTTKKYIRFSTANTFTCPIRTFLCGSLCSAQSRPFSEFLSCEIKLFHFNNITQNSSNIKNER